MPQGRTSGGSKSRSAAACYGTIGCANLPHVLGGSTQHELDMKPPKKAKQKSTAAKQRLISATSKSGGSLRRSGTNLEGSNMNYETKAADLWERTKAWADKNRTISGALVGGAAGTIVPGLGTAIGAVVGAGIGFASSMEKKE